MTGKSEPLRNGKSARPWLTGFFRFRAVVTPTCCGLRRRYQGQQNSEEETQWATMSLSKSRRDKRSLHLVLLSDRFRGADTGPRTCAGGSVSPSPEMPRRAEDQFFLGGVFACADESGAATIGHGKLNWFWLS